MLIVHKLVTHHWLTLMCEVLVVSDHSVKILADNGGRERKLPLPLPHMFPLPHIFSSSSYIMFASSILIFLPRRLPHPHVLPRCLPLLLVQIWRLTYYPRCEWNQPRAHFSFKWTWADTIKYPNSNDKNDFSRTRKWNDQERTVWIQPSNWETNMKSFFTFNFKFNSDADDQDNGTKTPYYHTYFFLVGISAFSSWIVGSHPSSDIEAQTGGALSYHTEPIFSEYNPSLGGGNCSHQNMQTIHPYYPYYLYYPSILSQILFVHSKHNPSI